MQVVVGDSMEECEGYKQLLQDVEKDEGPAGKCRDHDYRGKLNWVVARAKHYAEKTGLSAAEILNAWESKRDYWYMNYYQEVNQPEIKDGRVRVFDTVDEMLESIGKSGFRCPHCRSVSTSPYECNSGAVAGGKPCDWKVYGLFGHLGRGVYVFVKEKLQGENIFLPVAWESAAFDPIVLGM